jgi:hypothetical protein
MTAYDIYPDLRDASAWRQQWHELVRDQRVLRHVNRHTGEIVDLYNATGSIFSVTPAVAAKEADE